MTYAFRLPDIGEGTAEAEIGRWHVKAGDTVQEDQLLVDVMTDKATVEMTSPVSGTILSIHGAVGDRVPVGSLLVEFAREGDAGRSPVQEKIPRTVAVDAEPVVVVALEAAAKPEGKVEQAPNDVQRPRISAGVRPLASPAVRKRAYERGIPLQFLHGTGAEGRIVDTDLDQYRDDAPYQNGLTNAAPEDVVTETKLIGLRRRIAEKMQQSKRQIPHFGYVEEFDLTELEGLRQELNAVRSAAEPKLTLLPFFMRAVVRLVKDFPAINARFDEEHGILRTHSSVHIGIAAQTPAGLMVPVVRHAERLDLWDSARELARVTQAARDGTAGRDELSGSTITLTSLGALGGIAATPIINHPEVAIIGPNKLVERPVVIGGSIVIRKMMNVSSSFDHRIIDGYDAAQFIQAMKRLIERPSLLFVERAR